MTLTSCSGERPPRNTATRVSFLPAILYPNPLNPLTHAMDPSESYPSRRGRHNRRDNGRAISPGIAG
jgi:hypothetical protein